MSTGGPDPNRDIPPDPEMAKGNVGDPAGTRLGMGSTAIAIIVVVIALLVVLQAIF